MTRTGSKIPKLELASSALLQIAVAEGWFRASEYMGSGPYEGFRAQKDEAERLVSQFLADGGGRDDEALQRYAGLMFPAWTLEQAEAGGTLDRLMGFAALQRAVDAALEDLKTESFARPHAEDFALSGRAEVAAEFSNDGLLRLRPEHAERIAEISANVVVVDDELVLYPHRLLAEERELIDCLFVLTSEPELAVWMAVDPYRSTSRGAIAQDLMLEHWHGPKLTPAVLDSLDGHDCGATFHGVVKRDKAAEMSCPLLGTWFDWRPRRDRGVDDPVKRLYVREVRPATPLRPIRNRELHAERDTRRRQFTHVDGKVAQYTAEEYPAAGGHLEVPPGRYERARKLWRVDGPMSNELWLTLTSLFFRHNELIEEHLGATLRSA